jgi:NAD dependent epimerase/dehydratase
MGFQDRVVVVTGAGGFIGSHLTEALLKTGAKVRALVRYTSHNYWGFLEPYRKNPDPRLTIMTGDVRDPALMEQLTAGADYVFNLAALIGIPYSYQAPLSYVETNVHGCLNILEACRRHNVQRLVQTSTSEVYGTARYTPIDEAHPLQAQSPYAATKIAADKLAESYYRSFDLPVTILRPFNTYGPRQSLRAVIPTIITQALAGNQIRLGNLLPIRDLTCVNDTVRAFMASALSQETLGKVVNCGSGRGVSIRELVQIVGKTLHSSLDVRQEDERVRPERSEVFTLICDNALAKTVMDWQPEISLVEGLSLTIEWIKGHLKGDSAGTYVV